MSTHSIPNSQGQVTQVNSGDIYGELWGSFGIDLTTSRGKIKSSKRLTDTLATTKMDNDDVQAFLVFGGYLINLISGGKYQYVQSYRNPRISGTWTSHTNASFDIGDETDAVVFDGKALVSTGTNIAASTTGTGSWVLDWWTTVTSGTALSVGKPHTMDVSRVGQETLFVTDGDKVRYYNTTAGHSTVTLATGHTACCLATDGFATWVGTYTNQDTALVYEIYVGEELAGTPIARRSYPIDGRAVLSMDIIDTIPYIVTDRGNIQRFNGRGFVTVASFPFADKGVTLAGLEVGNINDENIARAIHPKGMRKDGKKLLININTNNQLIETLAGNPLDNDDIFTNVVVDERSPSGIWEYDTETGVLNHRYALTYPDYKGHHRQQSSGPILVLNNQYTRILTAGRVESDRTDIFAESPDDVPFSYFITPEIVANTVSEAWETLALKADTLKAGESIEIKYRTKNDRLFPLYGEINWLSATEFTTTADWSLVVPDEDGSYNYEVELLSGYNAGEIAQITNVSASTSTYTVTIDSAIGSTGTTSHARIQNWKKIDYTYDSEKLELDKIGLAVSAPWIQFKIIMRGLVTIRHTLIKGNSKSEL